MILKKVSATAYNYRGMMVYRNDNVPIGKKGRYETCSTPFVQLTHAKAFIDSKIKNGDL